MTVPLELRRANMVLREVRGGMRLSQSQFAAALVEAGAAIGVPNVASKRLVQKWESGEHAVCSGAYGRALERLTGLALGDLGFSGGVAAQRGALGAQSPFGDVVAVAGRIRDVRRALASVERDLDRWGRALAAESAGAVVRRRVR